MNQNIMTIQGIEGYEVEGTAYLKLETVARGLGFTQDKNGVEYIRWETVNSYLKDFGFPSKLGKDDFIPENVFYRLAMKARNEAAERFQALIADEIIPAIRKHGAYIAPQAQPQGIEAAALQAVVQPITAALEALTATVQALSQRVEGMDRGGMRALPPPPEKNPFEDNPFAPPPDKPMCVSARKLWMRLASEKLDLLSARYGKSNNDVLHKIYQDMEEHFDTVMDEERNRVMEEYGLEKCSVLLAIFFDRELRDYFQRYVDYNLAPENRGW